MNSKDIASDIRDKNFVEELRLLRNMRERNKISKNDYERYLRILRRRHYMEIFGGVAPASGYDLVSRILSVVSVLFIMVFVSVSITNLFGIGRSANTGKTYKYSSDVAIKENEGYLYTSQGRKDIVNPNHIDLRLLPEEAFQTNRIRDISVRLGNLDIELSFISELFCMHLQRLARANIELDRDPKFTIDSLLSRKMRFGGVLRFRVFLRDERYFDAILIPGCSCIAYAESAQQINVEVRDIACFRATPVKDVPEGRSSECLSDAEAIELFHNVCAIAARTRFNLWDSVSSFLPKGVWNKYHPVWSSFVLAVLGLVYIIWGLLRRRSDEKALTRLNEKVKKG